MSKKIIIPGWQSWSPIQPKWYEFKRQCDYSPHGINKWKIKPCSKIKKPISGWCSWYAYGKNINEEKILRNSEAFSKYKVANKEKYIIIDDGWTKWGDWKTYHKSRFSKGMKHISLKIKELDLKPGLWIAPFLVDKNSQYAQINSDCLVKNKMGLVDGFRMLPFNIPYFFNKAILDLEKPKVFKLVATCLTNIIENWGFELLKLDFLYSIYFNPRYKTPVVPDQILKELLSFIRKAYPHVYTIGCGCPLGPAAGLVDSMRISADIINPSLDNLWPINVIVNNERLNLLEINLNLRSETKKIWNIDPDVFVSRRSTGLSQSRVDRLKMLINKSKGNMIFGDDLTKNRLLKFF